jgi:hypothetical protein
MSFDLRWPGGWSAAGKRRILTTISDRDCGRRVDRDIVRRMAMSLVCGFASIAAVMTACTHPAAGTAPHVAMPAPPPVAAPPPRAGAPESSAETPDRYEALVAKAEAGDPVDFYELRMAFLRSRRYRLELPGDEVDSLHAQMFKAMDSGPPQLVFDLAQRTLKLLYIDLDAHKARRQACALLGRSDCAKYKEIALGLLRSVIQGRDGKTCLTAWEVVSVAEEYFVMRMLGLKVVGQSLTTDHHTCDKLDVVDKQDAHSTFYFDIGVLLGSELGNAGR